ncbi:MAG: phosphatase PAP2 family protein, partial [Chloroflexota bacterium]|nr:phosphatase PAP2 family protein [Chloroflexota bacterium]
MSLIDWLWSTDPLVAIQQALGPAWIGLGKAISLLGDTQVVAALVALALWLRGRHLAYGLLGIALLGSTLNFLIGRLVDLPRPQDPRLMVHARVSLWSFPSGHTEAATTMWGSLAAVRQIPRLVAVLIVPAVMFSRLYLGAHFVGDVLGGLLLGLAMVLVYLQLWPH